MISADSVEHTGFCTLTTLVCSLKNIRFRVLPPIIFCLIPCLFCPCCWAQGRTITGRVRDTSGAVVAGADVILKVGRGQRSTRTNEEGQFAFPAVDNNTGKITVHARGFLPELRTINFAREKTDPLQLVLRPSVASEQVIVSASHNPIRLPEPPGSSILISQSAVDFTPALRVDDALRQVPGFSL